MSARFAALILGNSSNRYDQLQIDNNIPFIDDGPNDKDKELARLNLTNLQADRTTSDKAHQVIVLSNALMDTITNTPPDGSIPRPDGLNGEERTTQKDENDRPALPTPSHPLSSTKRCLSETDVQLSADLGGDADVEVADLTRRNSEAPGATAKMSQCDDVLRRCSEVSDLMQRDRETDELSANSVEEEEENRKEGPDEDDDDIDGQEELPLLHVDEVDQGEDPKATDKVQECLSCDVKSEDSRLDDVSNLGTLSQDGGGDISSDSSSLNVNRDFTTSPIAAQGVSERGRQWKAPTDGQEGLLLLHPDSESVVSTGERKPALDLPTIAVFFSMEDETSGSRNDVRLDLNDARHLRPPPLDVQARTAVHCPPPPPSSSRSPPLPPPPAPQPKASPGRSPSSGTNQERVSPHWSPVVRATSQELLKTTAPGSKLPAGSAPELSEEASPRVAATSSVTTEGQGRPDRPQLTDDEVATFFLGTNSHNSKQGTGNSEDKSVRKDKQGHDNSKEKEALTQCENGRTTEKKDEAEVTLRHKPKSQLSLLIENLCVVLSGLYGILLVVLGLVIPLTEIFANQKDHRFEIFYLYLYGISIIFLSYVYLYLLRRNRLRTELVTRTLSRSMSWTRNWAKSWMPDNNPQRSSRRKRMVSLDETNHHTGTFYLRLGVLGFGIGSMIHSGLTFGKFYGSITDGQCVRGAELMLKPLFHLGFTFFQLYFVFMNSKMCIHRYKILARFGLMHMAATNICVWMRSIVVETLHEIHHSHHLEDHAGEDHASDHGDAVEGGPDPHHPRLEPHTQGYDPSEGDHRSLGHGNLSLVTIGRKLLAAAAAGNESVRGLLESTCSWNNMMGSAVDKAGPYLYPCTIEYSLMCAGILYVMWNNVGSRPRRRPVSQVEEDESDRKVQRMSVDCTGSSRGLFTGIFLTVAAIISIIAFYVMVEQPKLEEQALLLTHLSETFIYLLTLFAIFMACLKMRQLHFHADHASDMEEVLIIIAYTGLLMFNMFSVIAATLSPGEGAALTIISNLTMMIQAAVQTIFMLAGDRLSAKSQLQERKKPGREYVTFLLLCNFAMWIINTFETQKPEHNPIQVHFYGPEAWSIFSHISVPLGIYYRFHSTVCLSNIWKNAWKLRKHSHSAHGAASHH